MHEIKSYTSKVPEFSGFLEHLAKDNPGKRMVEGKWGEKNLQQYPLFYQIFVPFLDHVYICLGPVIYEQKNAFLCTPWCLSAVSVHFLPVCLNFPPSNSTCSPKSWHWELGGWWGTFKCRWECLEELLWVLKVLPKDFVAKRKSVSGSSFKQCKTRNVMTWYAYSWSIATEVCQG